MSKSLRKPIEDVRLRQRLQHVLRCTAWGTFFAALILPISPLLAGLVFLLAGRFFRNDSRSAARLIDKHYQLKDRILTAETLLRRPNQTPMEQLQLGDAEQHLAHVKPAAVLPLRLPKIFYAAVAVFAVDYAGPTISHHWFNSRTGSVDEIMQTNLPVENQILQKEIVTKTKELARNHPEEKTLSEISEQLGDLMKQFEMSANDPKESLSTLSEMDEALQTAAESLQLETMSESMRELAEAFEIAEKTLPISKALQKMDFDKAASALKKLDAEALESLTKPERKAMADKMESAAKNAENRNQKSLQEATQKMSDAMKSGDCEQGKSAAEALAGETEKHGVRLGIGKSIDNKRMTLSMMKADNMPGNMNGGNQINKTKQASNTWGSGSAGNPNDGQQTNLNSKRQQQTLTGRMTEGGDSVTETLNSNEMTAAKSVREYREQYQQFQKISEAVLDSEPIPLGQRQTIRRYFESIRPAEIEN